MRFNCLLVIRFVDTVWTGKVFRAVWLCKCDCGKEIIIRGDSLQNKRRQSCGCYLLNIRRRFVGKNNPNYKDGKYTKEILELKESIRKRDNYICQNCSKIQEEHHRKLDVHHIDGDDTNNDPENMITLCNSCHKTAQEKLFKLKGGG